MPAIARQQYQIAEQLLRAGVDGEVDAIALGHVGDLLGRALVQVQFDLRITLAEASNHLRQHVARLRVRGRDGEHAGVLGAELVGDALEVADFPQRPPRCRNDDFTRRRERRQALALAYEYAQAELVLELPHLLADAGL